MTLQELKSKCYSNPGEWKPVTFYVFNDENYADNWVDANYNGGDSTNTVLLSVLLCVMRSDYKDEYYMKEDILNAEVEHFYAVEKDVIVVVIDFER